MKKIFMAIAALLILGISASAQDGKSIYKKYSDMDGVEAVYISPAMFKLIGRIPDINIGDDKVNLASVIKSMNGLYILNTSDPKIGDGIYSTAEKFVKKGQYELLMEAKENGEATRMFTVGTEKIVKGFVLLSKSGDDTSFISIDGEIEREKLEEAIAEAAAD